MKLRSYRIAHDEVELTLYVGNEGSAFEIGQIVQVGIEIPPIPGLRGTYMIQRTEISVPVDEVPVQTLTLAPADPAQYEPDSRVREIIARDHGPAPDWSAIWDELGFLAGHRRASVLASIQEQHRDRLAREERERRITESAAQLQSRLETLRQTEAAAVLRRAEQLRNERLYGDRFQSKPRKIDLEDEG
jgi:hypothetical protein